MRPGSSAAEQAQEGLPQPCPRNGKILWKVEKYLSPYSVLVAPTLAHPRIGEATASMRT